MVGRPRDEQLPLETRRAIAKRWQAGESSELLSAEFDISIDYPRAIAHRLGYSRSRATAPPDPVFPADKAGEDAIARAKHAEACAYALRLHAKRTPLTAIAAITRIPYEELARLLPLALPVAARAVAKG